MTSDIFNPTSIQVDIGGTLVGTEQGINFVTGATAVDNPSQGRVDVTITGGGGSLTITDGVNTVNGTTQITVSGATVGGTTPDATLTISGSAGGTVTSVSVVSVNGFAGTVANATSTPAITLETSITGILKGNGTAISEAVGDTDYQNPIVLTTTGSSGAATFSGDILNIPQYSGGGGSIPQSIFVFVS